jgi:hypothetical protein
MDHSKICMLYFGLWKNYCYSNVQETPKVHYCFHKSYPLNLILTEGTLYYF